MQSIWAGGKVCLCYPDESGFLFFYWPYFLNLVFYDYFTFIVLYKLCTLVNFNFRSILLIRLIACLWHDYP
jgi:hypothetical protein